MRKIYRVGKTGRVNLALNILGSIVDEVFK